MSRKFYRELGIGFVLLSGLCFVGFLITLGYALAGCTQKTLIWIPLVLILSCCVAVLVGGLLVVCNLDPQSRRRGKE